MLLSHAGGTQSICCLTCNATPHVCFTLSISCLLLCCCSMSVVLGPFAALLVMPRPMFASLCPSAVYCYVAVPCMWQLIHLLYYLQCHTPCPFHSVQQRYTVMLQRHTERPLCNPLFCYLFYFVSRSSLTDYLASCCSLPLTMGMCRGLLCDSALLCPQ